MPIDLSKTPHLIRDEAEYDDAVAEIDRLLDLDPAEGSPEEQHLDFLTLLVEDYDRRQHVLPGGPVTPQQVVDFMRDQRGPSRSALAQLMGARSRVSDFFGGRRALSTRQIARLRGFLGVPADLLLAAPEERVPRRGVRSKATRGGVPKTTRRKPSHG